MEKRASPSTTPASIAPCDTRQAEFKSIRLGKHLGLVRQEDRVQIKITQISIRPINLAVGGLTTRLGHRRMWPRDMNPPNIDVSRSAIYKCHSLAADVGAAAEPPE
jgi:hypothetical protein